MITGAWAAVAVVMITLSGMGRLVSGSHTHSVGPVWWGWGLLALLMTLYVTIMPGTLTPFLVANVGLALFGYARHWPTKIEADSVFKLIVLSLPLFWLWSQNQVFAWDDFAHRLPSYWFATKFDSLPNHSLPPSLSVWPAYPYGLTVLGVAISRMMGEYVELAIALVNGSITVAFAGVVARQLAGPGNKISWQVMAAALVLMTVINPYMDREFTASAYQEASLSLAVVATFLMMRPYLLDSQRLLKIGESLCLGLTLALVVGLKQVGLVLAVLLVIPFWGVMASRQKNSPRALLLTSCAMFVPMLAIWLLWRFYVKVNIGGGEFAFLPLHEWHWDLIPDMLAAFGEVLLKKLTVMPSLIAVSVLAVFAYRGSRLQGQRLSLLLAAFVGWAYFGFLMVTYLGTSFSVDEIKVLASFSRYMQHVNWMLWVVLILAMKEYMPTRHRLWPWVQKSVFVLVLVPLVMPSHYIRKSNAEVVQMIKLAVALPSLVPTNTTLMIHEPANGGFRRYPLQYYVGYDYEILQAGSTWDPEDAVARKAVVLTLGKPLEPIIITDCRTSPCLAPQTVPLP